MAKFWQYAIKEKRRPAWYKAYLKEKKRNENKSKPRKRIRLEQSDAPEESAVGFGYWVFVDHNSYTKNDFPSGYRSGYRDFKSVEGIVNKTLGRTFLERYWAEKRTQKNDEAAFSVGRVVNLEDNGQMALVHFNIKRRVHVSVKKCWKIVLNNPVLNQFAKLIEKHAEQDVPLEVASMIFSFIWIKEDGKKKHFLSNAMESC